MTKRHERTLARRMAVQVLYEHEITETPVSEILTRECVIPGEGSLPEYSVVLIKGVESHADEIAQRLDETSQNWSIDRMPLVDRAIMDMATFEMLYVDQVPISVSINEAVELAKSFGGEDESPHFVNGILGCIARVEDEKSSDKQAAQSTDGDAAASDASTKEQLSEGVSDQAKDAPSDNVEVALPVDNAAEKQSSTQTVTSSVEVPISTSEVDEKRSATHA